MQAQDPTGSPKPNGTDWIGPIKDVQTLLVQEPCTTNINRRLLTEMDQGQDEDKRGDQLSSEVRHSQPFLLVTSAELSKTPFGKLCRCTFNK
ncbi:hypothetical protein PIB30_016337 [Stylosanthes scabra]|uniref:Uncharacterized protein n=1 Tax=Stylosanthes scabra TaxID=79078 RepID=A0ABU6S7L7_9FABA|nr:hypothetical protein [Stylosanthes scabra]